MIVVQLVSSAYVTTESGNIYNSRCIQSEINTPRFAYNWLGRFIMLHMCTSLKDHIICLLNESKSG